MATDAVLSEATLVARTAVDTPAASLVAMQAAHAVTLHRPLVATQAAVMRAADSVAEQPTLVVAAVEEPTSAAAVAEAAAAVVGGANPRLIASTILPLNAHPNPGGRSVSPTFPHSGSGRARTHVLICP